MSTLISLLAEIDLQHSSFNTWVAHHGFAGVRHSCDILEWYLSFLV